MEVDSDATACNSDWYAFLTIHSHTPSFFATHSLSASKIYAEIHCTPLLSCVGTEPIPSTVVMAELFQSWL